MAEKFVQKDIKNPVDLNREPKVPIGKKILASIAKTLKGFKKWT